MIPLNIYLHDATKEQIARAVIEYGNAIKDLVAANIFPGDMLWKNFGVTRHGKVVFYDYDEIEYLTDCNFRKVPAPRTEEEEMSGEIWYSVRRPEGRVPRDLQALPAWQPERARGVHEAPCRPARPGVLAGAQRAHQGGPRADVFPYDTHKRFRAAAPVFVTEGDPPCRPTPSSLPPPPARRSAACSGRLRGPRRLGTRRGGHPGRRRARRHARRRGRRVLFGNCLMAGPGPGARAPGDAQGGPARQHRAVTLSRCAARACGR